VKVLAARPHAGWGELHGLYETTHRAAEPPMITLWMRTARQKRVVAFRTFLRTLLHEVGHHVDYTLLRLGDSFHTQGFYARESHLFHQLVTDGGILMASLEEQMSRMARTGDDFAAAIKGVSDAALTKRPDDKSWSAKETLCHLRDTEESFMTRFQSIMEMDEPRFMAAEPDRWATERQYQRNDAGEALQAFRTRREETLRFLHGLRPEQWDRGGCTPRAGRMTVKDFVGPHRLARRQPPGSAQARTRGQALAVPREDRQRLAGAPPLLGHAAAAVPHGHDAAHDRAQGVGVAEGADRGPQRGRVVVQVVPHAPEGERHGVLREGEEPVPDHGHRAQDVHPPPSAAAA
jgi:uncharacterized damage-inducible protein DinB